MLNTLHLRLMHVSLLVQSSGVLHGPLHEEIAIDGKGREMILIKMTEREININPKVLAIRVI